MIRTLSQRAFSTAPLLLSLAALGWAGNTIAGRMTVGEVSPMVVVFLRWSFVIAILLVSQRKSWPQALPEMRARLKWVLIMGGFGLTGFNALFYAAAQHTTAINLGIIQCTMPAFILVGVALVYRTALSPMQIAGTALTMVGVIAIVGKGNLEFITQMALNQGDGLMLMACLFYAGYTLGLRNRPKIANMTMMTFLAASAWCASLPLLGVEIIFGKALWPDDLSSWAVIIYIALIPSLMCQVFYMRGVDLIGPGRAGVYSNLVPIYSAILGVIILNEQFHLYHLVSILLVFAGLAIISKKPG